MKNKIEHYTPAIVAGLLSLVMAVCGMRSGAGEDRDIALALAAMFAGAFAAVLLASVLCDDYAVSK